MLSGESLFMLDLVATFAPYMIITLSLNLEYGFGGVPNFGKTLAVAGGAFMVGYLPGRILAGIMGVGQGMDYVAQNAQIITEINNRLVFNVPLSLGILLITLVAVILFGAFLGLLVTVPVVRLRADYLAMTFLAAGEVILVIGNNYPPLVGGTLGIGVPDPFGWASTFSVLGLSPGEMRNVTVTLFMAITAIIIFLYAQKLTHSPLGRVLRAIRDDENSALALGKDVTSNRLKVIIFASAIAAIGGALYAFYTANVISTAYSRVSWTFWPWVMVMLGGAANNLGVVCGTFIFVAVRKLIIFYKDIFGPFIPFDVVWLDMLLLGAALVFILLYKPEGLLPEKPIKTIKIEGPPPPKREAPEETSSSQAPSKKKVGLKLPFKFKVRKK
ncbi:MAG: branched-chain amino acid ABC transporter permease [Candidatus Verstraetearchaeota archaeon]|nr:branched-chain amino acid ABC transporter permease [Candidatus Verstraetearchaeota archaeon]